MAFTMDKPARLFENQTRGVSCAKFRQMRARAQIKTLFRRKARPAVYFKYFEAGFEGKCTEIDNYYRVFRR
jgi:hypothetical protein